MIGVLAVGSRDAGVISQRMARSSSIIWQGYRPTALEPGLVYGAL